MGIPHASTYHHTNVSKVKVLALLTGHLRKDLEEDVMTDKTCWESVKAEGGAVLDKLKEIVREGNVRRVRIRQGDRTIAEFPLTAGAGGAGFLPAPPAGRPRPAPREG